MISSSFSRFNEEIYVPGEILTCIFQFLNENDASSVILVNKEFQHQLLRCSPFRNIIHLASHLKYHGLDEYSTPCLIKNEKLPLLTDREITLIQKLNRPHNSLFHIFLASNNHLRPELSLQIFKATDWTYEECQNLSYTRSLANLCEQILTNYETDKTSINSNPLLNTTLFHTTFKGKKISQYLKGDQELLMNWTSSKIDALLMVSHNGAWLKYADQHLKKDRDVVFAAMQDFYPAYRHADPCIWRDREFVLSAVKCNGNTLSLAHPSLKKDREIVFTAVKQCGGSLYYADESMKKDKEIVMTAISEYFFPFDDADDSLKRDREFLKTVVHKNSFFLTKAHKSMWEDKELVLEAVRQNGDLLEYAHESLKKDIEVVRTAVAQSRYALKFAENSLKTSTL